MADSISVDIAISYLLHTLLGQKPICCNKVVLLLRFKPT